MTLSSAVSAGRLSRPPWRAAERVVFPPAPDWLTGLWRRESMERADGSLDRTTRVFWGQTGNLFVDIRVPADRPLPTGCRGFRDLGLEQLLQLADQQAFAGHVEFDDEGLCNWIRHIDYQPDAGRPDRGRLTREGDILHERGAADSVIGLAYHEVYRRENAGAGRRLALRLEAATGAPFGGAAAKEAILVVLDDRFLFARARPRRLPRAKSLRLLAEEAAGDRDLLESYLDCEISLGWLDEPWRIGLSTLPWREGARLFAPGRATLDAAGGLLHLEAAAGTADWRIHDSSLPTKALCALFNA